MKPGRSPDSISERIAESNEKLTIRLLDSSEGVEGMPFVLIEASADGLRMLSALLNAVAESPGDGFSIAPDGAGSSLFSPEATLGLYLHRKH